MRNKILILSTGGTIAGKAEDALQSSQYHAGAIKACDLLQALPEMNVDLSVEEIAQIDSIEMHSCIWQELLDVLHKQYHDYDGFVITHGTDTMEESSFALDLLYRGEKAVVFVGAIRPSNAIGSDGVKNLCSAIILASKASGVLVLMNDKIYNPKTIYKAHTYNIDSFKSRNGGEMGYVLDQNICFFQTHQKMPQLFSCSTLHPLPCVEIVYIYAGMTKLPLYSNELKGLVIAGCGAGNIPSQIKEQLHALQDQGVMIVASSRGSEGFVLESDFIPSFGLNPAKARILLALCLKNNQNKKQIQATFSAF